jgi:hypothetical protein
MPLQGRTASAPDAGPYVVYTMASDAMLAYAAVFLESFRRYNPLLPLRIIPYDTCRKIAPLATRYGADMVERDFHDFDTWAATLFDEPIFYGRIDIRRRLRKFAAFECSAREFLYIDLDSVVLASFDPLFGHIEADRAQLVYTLEGGNFVYRADVGAQAPTGERFADGLFVAARRHLDLKQIQDTTRRELAHYKAVRHPELISQPLLNFVCHQRQLAVAKASALGVQPVDVDIGPDGSIELFRDAAGNACAYDGTRVLRAHWAGKHKYDGTVGYRPLADHFISSATKNGRLQKREAAALSFSIGA